MKCETPKMNGSVLPTYLHRFFHINIGDNHLGNERMNLTRTICLPTLTYRKDCFPNMVRN